MTVNTLSLLLLGLAAVAIAGQPAAAADAAAGRQKARQCQTCHGIDGLAKIPIAPHIAGDSQISQIGRASSREKGVRPCRSRVSPTPETKKHTLNITPRPTTSTKTNTHTN